jgi:hypothetical protein
MGGAAVECSQARYLNRLDKADRGVTLRPSFTNIQSNLCSGPLLSFSISKDF